MEKRKDKHSQWISLKLSSLYDKKLIPMEQTEGKNYKALKIIIKTSMRQKIYSHYLSHDREKYFYRLLSVALYKNYIRWGFQNRMLFLCHILLRLRNMILIMNLFSG